MLSDPKAMQHAYANSHSFVRQKRSRNLLKMFSGPSLGVVDVDNHKRQRRVVRPTFGSLYEVHFLFSLVMPSLLKQTTKPR